MLLSCKGLSKSFGVTEILQDVSFIIEEKEKAAVVGVNGAGKTTVFKILSGGLERDGGEIFIKKDISIAYMPQDKIIESERSVYDEMLTVFEDVIELEKNLRSYEEMMASESGGIDYLTEKYNRDMQLFEEKNGYEYESRIRGVLKGLGFSDTDAQKRVSSLSGGEKTRVALGKLLLSRPDMLLLDEPTNHLDIDAVNWLEGYLLNYPGGIVIISHDRYFLDKIVTKVIEVEHKKSYVYNGNYSDFAVMKEINREIALKKYEDQQKEIKRQEEVIRLLRSFNREKSIKRAKSREKMLSKMEVLDKPENKPDAMRLSLMPKRRGGNDALTVSGLSKAYGKRVLFTDVSFLITNGEKVALIGPNGIGKTTLLKIILNQLRPDSGGIRLGTNVSCAYYDQENMNIKSNKTILDEIYDTYPRILPAQIRNILAAFVFTGEDVYKTVSSLSGGEKARVAFAKIMLSGANLLLLDEPTNHLDIYSREIIENAINSYTGTVLYVSHDRYFINGTADKILELTETGIKTYLGNYDYYMEKRVASGQKAVEQITPTGEKAAWAARKEEEAVRRRFENALLKCEKEIEETEELINDLNMQLQSEETATNAEKAEEAYNKKIAAEDRLKELYAEWEGIYNDFKGKSAEND